jgi:SOS-response transcriptional repressor LexA/transcriptional regulator with XRE-family HTH domain
MAGFGEFAKERIKRLAKSQKDLAARLDVSPAYISQILTGKKNPPDLGKSRNRAQLIVWADFLEADRDEILEMVQVELHGVTPRPRPRYPRMRDLLISSLIHGSEALAEEIRHLELHPAENLVIGTLTRVYLIHRTQFTENRAHGMHRFKELFLEVRGNREFIEGELPPFARECGFAWTWDADANDIRFYSESREIREAVDAMEEIMGRTPGFVFSRTVPVVGHVSAGSGFEYTDGGFPAGEGFEQVELPPGVNPALADRLYCVRIRGDSLREFISEGALLFIKPESWEEIRDGDLVIFKDREEKRAFVKKVEFSGESLILKSMNSQYRNIVCTRSQLCLLERVISIML